MSVTSSRFIQLQGFAGGALLEYVYNSVDISTSRVNFLRIKNFYTGTMTYVNATSGDNATPLALTGNVLDNTVQRISDNKWAHLDIDRPIKFFEQSLRGPAGQPVIKIEELYEEIDNEVIVTYDTVRIHFLQGYTFGDLAGIIIRASYRERSGTNSVFVLNYAYLKENDNIHLNKDPVFLGDRVYNRYIEIKIPSLADLVDVNQQLGVLFSSDGNGFLSKFPDQKDATITFEALEVEKLEEASDGQLYLYTHPPIGTLQQGSVQIEIPDRDNYASIAARIQESDMGDYYEYYPMYNGSFIEDFVANRTRLGDSIIVSHEIQVVEHLNLNGDFVDVVTHRHTSFQETGFDSPMYFRPIIINNNAVAYSLEYTMQIVNRTDNGRIIRMASVTSTNPRKYGRSLQKLQINTELQPIKVVNKVLINNSAGTQSTGVPSLANSFASNTGATSPVIVKPLFSPIQYYEICVNANTLFMNGVDKVILEADKTNPAFQNEVAKINLEEFIKSDIIYGQGESIIYLNPFDNFFKFKLYRYVTHDGISQPEIMDDLKNGPDTKYYLVFTDSTGEPIRFPAFDGDSTIDIRATVGELIFRVDGEFAKSILSGSNRNFYITMESLVSEGIRGIDATLSRKNFEIVIYRGVFDTIDNFKQINNVNFILRESILKDRITQIDARQVITNKLISDFERLLGDVKSAALDEAQQALFDKFESELEQLKSVTANNGNP